MSTIVQPEYLDTESALVFLGWSKGRRKLYALITAGKIPHYREYDGYGRIYLKRADLVDYMERHRVEVPA